MNINRELIGYDVARLPRLLCGFIILSLGISLNVKAGLGLSSWSVFHDGLANVTPFTFGQVIQMLGIIILGFSVIVFKTKVGPGTLLNILLVGFMIDWYGKVLPIEPDNFLFKAVVLAFGIFFMTLGRGIYISSRLGAGPRDGLFVGLSRITQVDVKYVKPAIEVTVLTIGYFLGGVAGIGTLIMIAFSGYLVQFWFSKFGYDSKKDRQRSLFEYMIKDTVTVKE